MINELKVLNISQPFAHFIFHRGKNVENRSRGTTIRGTIAIYASKTKRKSNFTGQEEPVVSEDDCAFGAIIGLVDITDSITPFDITDETREWFGGPFGYVLTNPRLLPQPIYVTPPKGAVTWWPLTDEGKLNEVFNQVDLGDLKPISNVEPSENEIYMRRIQTELNKPIGLLIKIVGEEPLTMQDCLDDFNDYVFENKIKLSRETRTIYADELLFEIFKTKEIKISQVMETLWNYLEEIE